MSAPHLGLLLPTRGLLLGEGGVDGRESATSVLDLAERAEALGFDSVWAGDSLVAKPRLEPLANTRGGGSAHDSCSFGHLGAAGAAPPARPAGADRRRGGRTLRRAPRPRRRCRRRIQRGPTQRMARRGRRSEGARRPHDRDRPALQAPLDRGRRGLTRAASTPSEAPRSTPSPSRRAASRCCSLATSPRAARPNTAAPAATPTA